MTEDRIKELTSIEGERIGLILQDLFRRISVLNDTLVRIGGELLDVRERLDRLEEQQTPAKPQT